VYFATIDCGTTDSCGSVLDAQRLVAKGMGKVAGRDTAVSGSRRGLREGFLEVFGRTA
jgi:hypothetical protein